MLDFEHVGLVAKKTHVAIFWIFRFLLKITCHVFRGVSKTPTLEISAQVASLAARIHLSRELSLAAGWFSNFHGLLIQGFINGQNYMGKWDYNPSYKGISPFITGRGPPCTDTHQIQISQVHPIGIILVTKYSSDFFGKWKVWMESNLNC